MDWACMGNYCFKDEKMTTLTTEWSAADHIESFLDAAVHLKVGLENVSDSDLFIAILQDIANSPWMEQRAKDGKQVILAGKG